MARPPNTDTRRAQIARAMVGLLARGGVPGATMRALAAETGLTQGVLHYHFPSKHDMVLAALAEIERRTGERLASREAPEDLDALIDALLAPGTADLPADPEALAAWVAIGDAARTDDLVRLAYGSAVTRIHALLAARLGGTPDASALAAAALCQIEGAWRIGHLAPWALPSGMAAATLKRMLRAASSSEPSVVLPAGPAPTRPVAPPPFELGVRLHARDRAWWDQIVRASPVAIPASVWNAVAAAYTAPGRHYHTLEHLAELARSWREVAAGPGWTDARASWLALLFHDIVYDVAAAPGENEERSAAMLAALVPDSGCAARLVRLTATHGTPDDTPLDDDAAHFLDSDMAILGASPARFARYEAQVAAEYTVLVPMEIYRAGRRDFFTRLLALPRIFRSDRFHGLLEARARANIARALATGG